MTVEQLMCYSKEELATYIIRNMFLRDIENEMKHIHIQNLLDKDQKLTDKAYWDERSLLNKIKKMPGNTFEERFERMKVWDEYNKLTKKNQAAYDKRQKEIESLVSE